MSDTPRTDAQCKSADRYGDRDVVPATLARELELERARLHDEVLLAADTLLRIRENKKVRADYLPDEDWAEINAFISRYYHLLPASYRV